MSKKVDLVKISHGQNLQEAADIKTTLMDMWLLYLEDLREYNPELHREILKEKGTDLMQIADKESHEALTAPFCHAYFIKADDDIAGFVLLGTFPNAYAPDDLYVQELYVKPEYRRQGIGRKTVRRIATDITFQKFCNTISLFTLIDNEPAEKFWKRVMSDIGYVDHGSEPKYADAYDRTESKAPSKFHIYKKRAI